MTTLAKLLGNIDDPRPTTKEASERPRRQSSSRSTDDAIAKAMDAITTTKTASEGGDQTVELLKLAESIQRSDAEGEKAASYQNGREMGRGFVDELASYTKAAHDVSQSQQYVQQKTAGDYSEQAILEKFASEEPGTFEHAVKLGFDEASGYLMKIAQDEFNAGYRETVIEHTKVAAAHYAMGFDAMASVIRSSRANSRQQGAR